MFNIVSVKGEHTVKIGNIFEGRFSKSKERFKGKYIGVTESGLVIFRDVELYNKGEKKYVKVDMEVKVGVYEIDLHIGNGSVYQSVALQEDFTNNKRN